eukprot:1137858-Pelagomonas_calceolata.AAC.1
MEGVAGRGKRLWRVVVAACIMVAVDRGSRQWQGGVDVKKKSYKLRGNFEWNPSVTSKAPQQMSPPPPGWTCDLIGKLFKNELKQNDARATWP